MRGVTDRTETASAAALGPLERRVMATLWATGPQSVGDVLDGLNGGSDRRLAYTTVMTILVRLNDKGLVTREKDGRNYRYTAAVDERSVEAQLGRRELTRLIERYGAASVAGFAAELGEGELANRLRDLGRTPRGTNG